MKFLKTLEKNKLGRDFVVGDLHGCVDQLNLFMDIVDFDPNADRMISVGDLADRGPKSFETLKLLLEPWFHCVKGNHEELLQDFLQGGPTGEWFRHNGGTWIDDLESEDIQFIVDNILPIINELPLLITVNGPRKFHVLHADLDEEAEFNDVDLEDETFVKAACLVSCSDGATGIWGRHRFRDFYAREKLSDEDVMWLRTSTLMDQFGPNLSDIFCGHTPVTMPSRIGAMVNLDTMAFATGRKPWCGLTVTEPASGRFWKVTDDIEKVDLRVIL